MPDPNVLYAVTAVVVLGLATWVVIVLAQPAQRGPEGGSKPLSREPSSALASPAAAGLDRGSPAGASHDSLSPGEPDQDESPTGPNALILVTAVGRTDPGLKRERNEDAFAILEDHHLFVIADGMGRHAAGEVASRLCVDAIRDSFRSGEFGSPREPALPRRAARLRGAILIANQRVLAAVRETPAYAGMGTTVVAAYFSPNNQRAYIAHVGDSRCYRVRRGELAQLTTDHTLGAVGIQGSRASTLARALGVEETVEVDVAIEAPLPSDVYLLCSDGLSRMVSADEIRATLLSTPDLEEATKALVDKANRSGGRDNITTILVRVDHAAGVPSVSVARAPALGSTVA